jgi:hypothetical protein
MRAGHRDNLNVFHPVSPELRRKPRLTYFRQKGMLAEATPFGRKASHGEHEGVGLGRR